jgi:hypothetical protein
MKILFVMRHPMFLKNFTAGLKHLLDRGHEIEILFSIPQRGAQGEEPMPVREVLEDKAAAELRSVSMSYLPPRPTWQNRLLILIATALDVRRYNDSAYDTSPILRERARRKTRVQANRKDLRLLLACTDTLERLFGPRAVRDALQWIIAHAPPDPATMSLLKSKRPDLMIVTPFTAMASEQAIYARAALALRIPVTYSMYSWDNLTNKGLVRPIPNVSIVWNDIHREELVRMHGVPNETVEVTGAGGYDMWFNEKPTLSRQEFCAELGLDTDKPFVLYTCSSGFIAGSHERPFVKRWLTALRQHPDPRVSSLGVLIRPHPKYAEPWEAVKFDSLKNVVVYPREGAIPFSGTARSDYFHSIFHSAAVVGINTSAMVESAIIGRPVMTIADPAYTHTQEGTLHFRHLVGYDFLQRANSIEENLAALAKLVEGEPARLAKIEEANRDFVASYIRPRGLAHPASECWADTIEDIVRRPDRQRRASSFSVGAAVLAAALPFCLLVDNWEKNKRRV